MIRSLAREMILRPLEAQIGAAMIVAGRLHSLNGFRGGSATDFALAWQWVVASAAFDVLASGDTLPSRWWLSPISEVYANTWLLWATVAKIGQKTLFRPAWKALAGLHILHWTVAALIATAVPAPTVTSGLLFALSVAALVLGYHRILRAATNGLSGPLSASVNVLLVMLFVITLRAALLIGAPPE